MCLRCACALDLETIDQDLVIFARKALLDVVRARYMECIHTGKIGNSVMASKILLYSVDVANDYVHLALKDWETVQASLTPSPWLVSACRTADEVVLWCTGRHMGLLPFLDAFNERNALYTLINYIDAHEYALDRLQFILGIDSGDQEEQQDSVDAGYDRSWQPPGARIVTAQEKRREREVSVQTALSGRSRKSNATHFSRVEAHQVILETLTSVRSVQDFNTDEHLITIRSLTYLTNRWTTPGSC